MLKKNKIFLLLFLLLFFPLINAESGTIFVGAKFWYTKWDSGILNWIGKEYSAQAKADYNMNIISDTDSGTGFLSGPLFGYQSTDGLWSVSFAPMVLSNFTQKLNLIEDQAFITVNTNVDVTRYDYDLAVAYSLSQLKKSASFLEYCRLFTGYKYQIVKIDYKFGIAGNWSETASAKYKVNMPTVGLGVTYPITDKIAAGMQGGIGKAFINYSDPDPKNSTAYNIEASLSFIPIEKMIIQLGYRYQQWDFTPTDQVYLVRSSSKDVTSGPILTLVYTF